MLAPLAVRVVVDPAQMVGLFTVTFGKGFTVTVTVCGVPTQPTVEVGVTV